MAVATPSLAQNDDEVMIKRIFEEALARGESYPNLDFLSNRIGARLSGSPQAAAAVEWTRQVMLRYADSVILQPLKVPHWVRGPVEEARILSSLKGTLAVRICALGNSIGTPKGGLTAPVIEVKSFDELKGLGSKQVTGKIVFFNRPMDPTRIRTFQAYGGAVDQRAYGAREAGRLGAIGVVVRSMSTNVEKYPHTGSLVYDSVVQKIPAVAISTAHANMLSEILKQDPALRFHFETSCEMLPDEPSFNVVGELKGSELVDKYIIVSGHLDSWDLGQGAHDDGAGCVQAMEALRLLKALSYKPRHTLRAVMFMNEENGLRGGREYARLAMVNNERHVAAIESDAGGFTPRGFSMHAKPEVRSKIKSWRNLLEPYGLTDFDGEGGGADIGPLASQDVTLIGFMPDSQRYFSYHHTEEDTFDKVNKRELELGAASMAALIYLIDKYGL